MQLLLFMKGFVTVATGKERYYKMAHNLLLSYRYHAKTKTPFAILCDRENEWTADFDRVIIIDSPCFSFMDKLRIFDLSPFKETVFVDADCLAYRDLNLLWELFKDSPDVGVLGSIHPLTSDSGWWDVNNLGELKDKVDYKMMCQGGVYYVRKSGEGLPAFMDTCEYIKEHYLEFKFRLFETTLADENIISLASCVHHFLPVKNWVEVFSYYPLAKLLAQDILSGTLEFEWTEYPGRRYRNSMLIHFGTVSAIYRWAYKKEVFKLKRGPVRLSNFWEYCLLYITHAWHKLLMTLYRLFGKKTKCTMEIYA